jgi:phosphoserine phosphatase
MALTQIQSVLASNDYLMPGALQLFDYFRKKGVISILASGNILPVSEYYQKLLGIDYIVGSQPIIQDGVIVGIDKSAYSSPSFKVDGIKQVMSQLRIQRPRVVAIGDSPTDTSMFELSDYVIAINPKGNIAGIADAVIEDDLAKVIPLLESRE